MNKQEQILKIIRMVKEKYPNELLSGYYIYNNKYIFAYVRDVTEDVNMDKNGYNIKKANNRYYSVHYSSKMIVYNPKSNEIQHTSFPIKELGKIKKICKFTRLVHWDG